MDKQSPGDQQLVNTRRSRTLLRILSSEIGLKLSGDFAGETLGIGTTWEIFQSRGIFPCLRDWLNSWVIDGATLAAVHFSMTAEMLSGPEDLLVSREAKRSRMKSSSHNNVLGISPVQGSVWWSDTSRGVWDLLKHDVKKEFNNSAFCKSVWAMVLGVVRVGIVETDLFNSLQVLQNSFVFLGFSLL